MVGERCWGKGLDADIIASKIVEGFGSKNGGKADNIEAQVDKPGLGRLGSKEGDLFIDGGIVLVLLQEVKISIIAAGSEEDMLTG